LLLISMLKNLPKRWHPRLRKCCLNRVPLEHWTRTAAEFFRKLSSPISILIHSEIYIPFQIRCRCWFFSN
jgi:hypothetical protein